jgi:hypothetical protein
VSEQWWEEEDTQSKKVGKKERKKKKKASKKEVFAIVVNCQHGLTETRTGIEKSAPAKAPHHVAAGAASQQ